MQSQLNGHFKASHTFEPATCEVCGKLFDNPAKLQVHVRKGTAKIDDDDENRLHCKIDYMYVE